MQTYRVVVEGGMTMMSFVPVFVPLCAVLALLFALYLAGSVRKEEEGTDRMKEISGAIREGLWDNWR